MAEFAGKTLEGKWWRPDSPDDAFDGVLQLEEDFAGSLTIKGLASKLFAFRLPSSRTLFWRVGISILRMSMLSARHLSARLGWTNGAMAPASKARWKCRALHSEPRG